MICLALTEATLDAAVSATAAALPHIDAVELRADYLLPAELRAAGSFPGRLADAGISIPVILTLRRAVDGGKWQGEEQLRLARLAGALRDAESRGRPFGFVDLESDLAAASEPDVHVQKSSASDTSIIRSLHDFNGTPANPSHVVDHLARTPQEIPKLAVRATSTADLRRLFEAMIGRKGRWIILGMGDYGVPSRVLSGRYGALLTFCSSPGRQAAPGHIDPVVLDELYRYRAISASTGVYCVIGNPVMHSRSPLYHNTRFRDDRLNAVYVAIQVDDLDEFFRIADLTGIRGVSVTIPHKEGVISRIAAPDGAVSAVGACNTLYRNHGGPSNSGSTVGAAGGWSGTNTDIDGFVSPLRREIGGGRTGRPLDGLRATVIGAGGAARGVVYGLAREGVEILILNRTVARAEAIAEEFSEVGGRIRAAGLDDAGIALSTNWRDIVVQTTSVGMHPQEDEDPASAFEFIGSEVVCDIIYTPEITRFLARARAAGCRVVTGRGMFDAQADAQFRLFRSVLSEQ